MEEIKFVKEIKNNEKYRSGFNELASQIFGIDFEPWYQYGYWTDRYEPYCYTISNRIVANVSVNKLDLIINGERKRAIQLGTVMTHPDYRNQGLSASLMKKIADEYESHYDMFYLFANSTVLDYYPKFGFRAVDEYKWTMNYSRKQTPSRSLQRLNGRNKDDLDFIYQFATERIPCSNKFGTDHTENLLMFYCMYVFPEHIHYIEEDDTIVIYQGAGDEIHIYDVICKKETDMLKVIDRITMMETQKVILHFTPYHCDQESFTREKFYGSEVLFVKTNAVTLPLYFKHPITSQA
ncbi:GNAT family N-acetyltransferase [Bacillus salitolerans]|uniref:GNAT family N-acetyltransferase n=1 Tax=Bacillus salitolerans TaxID=1437434 RepID=A0ABW4LNP7_9BACI